MSRQADNLPPLRIGAVNYLNTKPLVYGLQARLPRESLRFDLPSRLADGLLQGRYDIALVPAVELFTHPDYRVISDACIACRGPVLSVKLYCRVPPASIRTLALDEGSRTSAALVQILLKEQHGVRPELVPLPIGAGVETTDADAVLLIGDRAIHRPAGDFAEEWDVGERWVQWTKTPFVFAVWTARSGRNFEPMAAALASARDDGLASLRSIAAAEAVGLSQAECYKYLHEHLHFVFGPAEQRGLQLFYEKAHAHGFAPSAWSLQRALAPGKTSAAAPTGA